MKTGNFGTLLMAFMNGVEAYLDVNSGKVIRVYRKDGEIFLINSPDLTYVMLKENPDQYVCLPHVCCSEIHREFLLLLHLSAEELNEYHLSVSTKYDLFLSDKQTEDGRYCLNTIELIKKKGLFDIYMLYQEMRCSNIVYQWCAENDIRVKIKDFYEYDENGDCVLFDSINDYLKKHSGST